jgi:hypothetical protein
VAVGADWTDNRNVVGYVNHLREAKMAGAMDSRPVYQSTPVLDLLLEASKPGRESVPHFLILDEMNLSHVERYFADFLSAMEARSGAIRFHEEGAGNTKAETGDLKPELQKQIFVCQGSREIRWGCLGVCRIRRIFL